MFLRLLTGFILLFGITACSNSYDSRIKISATTWIGYTPLFYAQEKGWLEPLNIKLLNITSLAENMYIYQAGNADAYTGTQYEYSILKKDMRSLQPIMVFDRSNGGDIIMSNLSLDALQNLDEPIDAYLEMDSINSVLLEDFLHNYGLEDKKIHYINGDQITIGELKMSKKPTLIVTYIPYNITLEQEGYKEIASTKGSLSLLVVDAMFTTRETYEAHKEQFDRLKERVDEAIEALKKDPKEFYETVNPYLLEITYEEFIASLEDIEWINTEMNRELEARLRDASFPLEGLIR